ncbi:MAG TPA: heme exporter protein CcmD [Burkholderiaceae bacterium]|nr:heme exporter protein CcmD [Burkholderiaceae bacterium]
MTWDSWAAFWAMGGRAGFVWGSYGVTLAVFALEAMALRGRRRRAVDQARRSAAAAAESRP